MRFDDRARQGEPETESVALGGRERRDRLADADPDRGPGPLSITLDETCPAAPVRASITMRPSCRPAWTSASSNCG